MNEREEMGKFLSDIYRIAIVYREPQVPENPYHPDPLREFDHQYTLAEKTGYDRAQRDMLEAGFVQEIDSNLS